ncbi:MAG TPA: AAA family ATPase, partial [Saprospiraceae bacterium]|nr:AAA family ATPase [Saprospiraceae bacterium]
MKTLAVRQVALTHFKNYHEARFTFNDRFNLISGRNGLGKTNLLDAIYYLSVGKSYFTPFDQRVVEQGESFFRLEGEVMKDSAMHHVLFKVQPGLTKTVTVDRIEINRISEHVGFIPIVFSAPRDIELVTGSGQARRRYFDHLLCQMDPEYLKALMEYNYLLQMRNAALKNGFTDLRRVVQTYDQQMAPYAQFIFEKRKWLIRVFEDNLQMAYLQLSEGREEV